MTHDYYQRLSAERLRQLRFSHLTSGLDSLDDDDLPPPAAEGAALSVPIAGFTEWVSGERPAHSIGWDWVVEPATGLLTLRAHSIRTNIMLVDAQGADAGRQRTEEAIGSLITDWDWPRAVLAAVTVTDK